MYVHVYMWQRIKPNQTKYLFVSVFRLFLSLYEKHSFQWFADDKKNNESQKIASFTCNSSKKILHNDNERLKRYTMYGGDIA